MPTTTTTVPPYDMSVVVSGLARSAGEAMSNTGVSVIGVLVPLAVGLLLALYAFARAAKMLGFSDTTHERYRDEYRGKKGYEHETYTPERMEYVGHIDGRYYRRRVGSKRRRYDN